MLKELNVEEILFIDIETVPIAPEFGKLAENWQKLWNHKMKFRIDEGEVSEDLYQSAGIYAEFGKIICISAGYVVQKNGESHFRVKSFYDNNEKILISNFFTALEKFARSGKHKLCAH